MDQNPATAKSHAISPAPLGTDVRSLATTSTAFPQGQILSFGPFCLLAAQRLLLEGNRPVRLGGRALDILIALLERRGELVSKRELMDLVWPNTVVEEGNLKVHVAGLRRALGDGRGGSRYLVNVPGRGYRFVAPVVFLDEPKALGPYLAISTEQHNLPGQLTRLIGRHEIIDNLIQQLSIHRLLTIVGSGGIGKTAVALVMAERLIGAHRDGVWLIDLAPITDPHLVPTALGAVLKLEIRSENPLPGLIVALRDKQMLLLLDNCEHVIEAAAALAAGILKGSRGMKILATSREALRVEGERTHRLFGLESPPASGRLNAAEVSNFPAAQLFVERAAAADNEFELGDGDAPSVADICRNLDGIPLAIEFAAARVGAFGVRGVAARLEDRLRLLTGGHRTALPRHRTIKATLDWSYQLLNEEEKSLLRRLAIFVGGFTLEAAGAATGVLAPEIAECIASLVMKSLVVAEMVGEGVRFRLLETTRAYALSMLQENGEADILSQRHAIYYRDLLEAASQTSERVDLSAALAPELDNIRAAFRWAFGPEGDGSIGVALAATSATIWFEMSLLAECRIWMEKALGRLDAADRGTRLEMVLQTSLGFSLMFTEGVSDRAHAALSKAKQLAESVGDAEYQLRAISGLASFCHRREDFQGALALGRRAEAIAMGDPDLVNLSTAEWLLCVSLSFLGEHAEALDYARRTQQRATPEVRRSHLVRSGMDHSFYARCVEVTALWALGWLDQSAKAARELVADSQTGAHAHPLSVCMALSWCGCMIPLRLGDMETAERCIAWLKDRAEKQASSNFFANGLGFEGLLLAARGDLSVAEQRLRASLDGCTDLQYTFFLSGLAQVLEMMGRLDEGLAAADEALQRAERANAFWWMPEALRVKGEVLLSSDTPDAAEGYLRRSLDMARRQGALSWELRTSMSLGRLRHAQSRTREARELLRPVYSRFSEGFDTVDLQSARRHLEEWT
jgi:predicted ATPase/DNA-binding winged helix-turn-helix (wHTH) protein